MNAEIIAVGSELLLGQIANTNGQFLSQELAQIGVNVYYHTVVGDNSKRLKHTIDVAKSRSNLIIFTGGLGPTKDDLTKETIASEIGKSLVYDEEAMRQIQDFFVKVKREMSPNNRKQALVIEGSQVLPNDNGMAPGMALHHDGIHYMLLPGPPKELKPMFKNYGRQYLVSQSGDHDLIESRVLRFFGIGESNLEVEIEDLIDQQTNPTIAPLAKDGEVTLRLTAKHHSSDIAVQLLDDTEEKIAKRVGQYLYGYGETSLAQELFHLLQEEKLTIASAESLTGGLFGQSLTRFSGASEIYNGGVICYSNEAKQNLLHVSEKTILEQGAVSEACAREMAEQVRRSLNANIGISFTGVAGPEPSEGKPVGCVFIGISLEGQVDVMELALAGSREAIRTRTVKHGCFQLLKKLTK